MLKIGISEDCDTRLLLIDYFNTKDMMLLSIILFNELQRFLGEI